MISSILGYFAPACASLRMGSSLPQAHIPEGHTADVLFSIFSRELLFKGAALPFEDGREGGGFRKAGAVLFLNMGGGEGGRPGS